MRGKWAAGTPKPPSNPERCGSAPVARSEQVRARWRDDPRPSTPCRRAQAPLRGVARPVSGEEQHRPLSGSWDAACLRGMRLTYVAITLIAAIANAYAASLDFVGAESVKLVADRVQVSQRWMVPLGALLASGAVGLLAGFAVPALGIAAATGLVLYFICAVIAHLRVRDREFGGALFFLLLAVAALTTSLAYHHHW